MKKILLSLTLLIIGYSVSAQDWIKKYDEVGVFENDLAYVRKNKKYGYVDKNGKEIIPCIYTYVGAFNEQGIVWVNKNGKYGIYNINGKVILPAEYDAISTFNKNTKSKDGNPYLMFKSLFSGDPDETRYSKNTDGKLFINNKSLKWVGKGCGRFDVHSPSTHKNLIPFDKFQTTEYITFLKTTDKWGVCDLDGNIIIPCNTYDFCYYPSENYMPVAKIIDGKYSINYIDIKTKNLVLDNFVRTLAATPVINGKFMVINDSGCYFMDMNGEKTGDTYEAVFPSDNEDIYTVYKDSKFGAINTSGQVIIDVKYKLLSTADNGLICFVDKGEDGKSKYGYMNLSGEIVSPPQYNAVKHFENKRAIVRKGDKYGCIDTLGREILPCRFSSIYLTVSPESDIYFVKEEEKGAIYAYKAYTTTRLFETSFKNVRNYDRDFKNVAFVAETGYSYGHIGCINKNGEMLIPFICASYDNAFKLYRKRQMEGKYTWTEEDSRLYSISNDNESLYDFNLDEKIEEVFWDF